MTTLLVDAETYSACDLRAQGAYKYATHPSTRSILWSVRDPGWTDSLVFEAGSIWDVLDRLKAAHRIEWTRNKPLLLVHWNTFDRLIVQHADPRTPLEHAWRDDDPEVAAIVGPWNTYWCDLRDVSLTYGAPGSLKEAARFWGGGLESKHEGAGLIRRWCVPNDQGERNPPESSPIHWEEFRAYARQDTNAMVPIYLRMLGLQGGHDLLDHWPHLRVIGRMNDRGVPVDVASAVTARTLMEHHEATVVEATREEYGFGPGQVKRVAEYLGLPNARRETLEAFVAECEDEHLTRLATARLATSGAARKKLDPMIRMADEENRVRYCFDYHGAWTRRLTSFGVQFQNMVRSPVDEGFFEALPEADWDLRIFEEVRKNIRGFVRAPLGQQLVAADYEQIELRTAAWLAGETWLLEAFRTGADPYVRLAAELFGVPEEEVTSLQRQLGKIVGLGCVYQLGWGGLTKQAAGYGLELEESTTRTFVDIYRVNHPHVCDTWAELQEGMFQMVGARPGTVQGVQTAGSAEIRLERWPDFVKLVRPSGFAQYFWRPEIRRGEWPDGGPKLELTYLRRTRLGRMERVSTYGGDTFQGLNQGTAADLLLHGMEAAERAGYLPIMSIHDEVVCEPTRPSADPVHELCGLLCELPDWAEGLPIGAEGWVGPRFTKV